MPEMMPYLELNNPDNGSCFKIIDNCGTLANIKANFGGEVEDCDECCPECETEEYSGDPITDGAWWTNPTDPNTNLFWGLMASSVYLEPASSIRRRGETTADRPPYTPRRLIVTTRLLGDGPIGLYVGESALNRILADDCGPCDGWEASLRLHCPDEDDFDDSDPVNLWEPDDQPPLIEGGNECEPCSNQDPDWSPTILGPVPNVSPTSIDSGRRNVMRLKFVYMDDIETPEDQPEQLANCAKWMQLVFEVLDDYEWGDPIEGVCDINRGWDDFESGYCRPHDWSFCLREPETKSCADLSGSEESVDLEPVRSVKRRTSKYCQPLYRSLRACLTPVLPTSADVGLGVTIKAGSEDLRNFRLDLYPAYNNVPSPETCEGELIYRKIKPCGQLFVPYLPAFSSLVIDGRKNQTWLTCRGSQPELAPTFIEGWDYSVFDPTCRMWVVGVADCLNHAPDFEVDPLQYFPRWQT